MKKILQYLFFLIIELNYSSVISAGNSIYSEIDTVKLHNTLTWVNLGIGGLAPGFDHFLDFGGYGHASGSISLSFQSKKHVISMKSVYLSQEVLGNDKLSSIELTYGLIHKRTMGYCSLSTGINATWFTKKFYNSSPVHPYPIYLETIEYKKIGVPLDFQLFLTGKWIGIGINGFLVIGRDFTTYGTLLCLQIGKLR